MSTGMSRRSFLGTSAAGVTAMSFAASATPTEGYGPVQLPETLEWQQLHTPCLLLDASAMERNLQRMSDFVSRAGAGVALRPHTKTHKCPIIAKRQLELGAIGICCAKVSEAEVMLDAGIENVLITSPVVTQEKIDRVIALTKQSDGIQMVFDNAEVVKAFNEAAQEAGTTLGALVDLNTGTQRTGVRMGEDAVKLAETVAKQKNLRFDGIQAYSGHLMHVHGHNTRTVMTNAALEKVIDTKDRIERSGIEVGVVTGGGTGTFDIDGAQPGYTDIQVGSYLFMDTQYRAIGYADGDVFDYFEPSLFVILTAISEPVPEKLITMDGGYKAIASDAIPEFVDLPGAVYTFGGDEHGIIRLSDAKRPVKLGDKFKLIVSHCDPTVNLYDHYYVAHEGQITEMWPIAARGKSQ